MWKIKKRLTIKLMISIILINLMGSDFALASEKFYLRIPITNKQISVYDSYSLRKMQKLIQKATHDPRFDRMRDIMDAPPPITEEEIREYFNGLLSPADYNLYNEAYRTGEPPISWLEDLYNEKMGEDAKKCFKEAAISLLKEDPKRLAFYLHLIEILDISEGVSEIAYLAHRHSLFREIPSPGYGLPRLELHILRCYAQHQTQIVDVGGDETKFWINILRTEPELAQYGFTGLRRYSLDATRKFLPDIFKTIAQNPSYNSSFDFPRAIRPLARQIIQVEGEEELTKFFDTLRKLFIKNFPQFRLLGQLSPLMDEINRRFKGKIATMFLLRAFDIIKENPDKEIFVWDFGNEWGRFSDIKERFKREGTEVTKEKVLEYIRLLKGFSDNHPEIFSCQITPGSLEKFLLNLGPRPGDITYVERIMQGFRSDLPRIISEGNL